MIDRETIELMHTELDGTNSAEDSRRLRAHLTENAEARAYFEDLERLFERLKGRPDTDPPSHLLHRILDAVPFGRAPWSGRQKTSTGAWNWLRGLAARPRLAYTAAFTLGLTIGVSAFFVLHYKGSGDNGVRSFLDTSQFYGMIGGAGGEGYDEVDGIEVDLEAVTGRVRLTRSGGSLVADVEINSERPIEWIIAFDSEDVAVEGFQRVEGDAGVFVTESAISSRQTGSGRYVVRFHTNRDATLMHLELYDSGQLILDKQLTTDLQN